VPTPWWAEFRTKTELVSLPRQLHSLKNAAVSRVVTGCGMQRGGGLRSRACQLRIVPMLMLSFHAVLGSSFIFFLAFELELSTLCSKLRPMSHRFPTQRPLFRFRAKEAAEKHFFLHVLILVSVNGLIWCTVYRTAVCFYCNLPHSFHCCVPSHGCEQHHSMEFEARQVMSAFSKIRK